MRVGTAIAAICLSLLYGALANAADFEVKSTIDAVTVYPSGAEVERLARTRLGVGEHTLVFRDLPANAVARSIRVEGKATGVLEIGSVDTRVVAIPSADPAAAESARRRLEEEIERLGDERATYQSEVHVAEAQKQFALNLVKLPGQGGAGASGQAGVREDWQQVSNLIAAQVSMAEKALHAATLKIRGVDRKLDDLKKKLASEAPRVERRTEVKVFVTARAALETELVVRYQVRSASWRAHYDARLATGSRTVAPVLNLVRRGTIVQNSGEPWRDVRLVLSTTRPSAGTSAPDLNSTMVDYEAPPVAVLRKRYMEPGSSLGRQALDANNAAKPESAPTSPVAAAEGMIDAVPVKAAAEISAFHALFNIAGRVTVLETGEPKRVTVDESKIEPQLKVRSVPRLDQRAFLYVKLTVPKSGPYLAGPVALFRDSTFVGNGRLPQLAAGEDHELGFGVDDAVRVRFAVVKESRGASGLISSSQTDERNFRITIKSLHERPVAATILDHLPVPLNDEIRLETSFKPLPTARNVEDKRGVFAWDSNLVPGSEQAIEFGYKLSWPSGKKIIFRD